MPFSLSMFFNMPTNPHATCHMPHATCNGHATRSATKVMRVLCHGWCGFDEVGGFGVIPGQSRLASSLTSNSTLISMSLLHSDLIKFHLAARTSTLTMTALLHDFVCESGWCDTFPILTRIVSLCQLRCEVGRWYSSLEWTPFNRLSTRLFARCISERKQALVRAQIEGTSVTLIVYVFSCRQRSCSSISSKSRKWHLHHYLLV